MLKFNAVVSSVSVAIPEGPLNGKSDAQSFIYRAFLPAPLIPSGPGYVEREMVWYQTATISHVMDAIAHQSLVNSSYMAVVATTGVDGRREGDGKMR